MGVTIDVAAAAVWPISKLSRGVDRLKEQYCKLSLFVLGWRPKPWEARRDVIFSRAASRRQKRRRRQIRAVLRVQHACFSPPGCRDDARGSRNVAIAALPDATKPPETAQNRRKPPGIEAYG
jgi:hypothetical protein